YSVRQGNIYANDPSTASFAVKMAPTQSADPFAIQFSSGHPILSVNNAGRLVLRRPSDTTSRIFLYQDYTNGLTFTAEGNSRLYFEFSGSSPRIYQPGGDAE